MKKKTIKVLALLLATMLLVPAAALGEEAEPQELIVNWEQVTVMPGFEQAVTMGDFVTLNRYGLSMWLPNGMQQRESEEYVYDLATEDESIQLMVRENEVPENITSTADLVEYLKTKADNGEVYRMRINGLFCLGLSLGEGDVKILVFIGDGILAQFIFPDQLNAGTKGIYNMMLASIQNAGE